MDEKLDIATIPWEKVDQNICTVAADWPLAGLRLTRAHRELFGITNSNATHIRVLGPDNKSSEYSITNNYLVPHYPSAAENQLNQSAEEFTLNRMRRFFYMAEPQLDVCWTHAAIAQAKKDYESCTDPDAKDTKARFLVGAMVNRMERLSRAFFQGDLQGTKIDLSPEQREALENASRPLADLRAMRRILRDGIHAPNIQAVVDEKLALIRTALEPIANEFYEYYAYLITPQHIASTGQTVALTDLVHLRNGGPDRDGILSHLVREMGKMWGFEEHEAQTFATENVVIQIGYAMAAIDETKNSMLAMLRNPKVLQSLTAAIKEYKATLPSESIAIHSLLDLGSEKLIREYAATSRTRAGIKSDDAESFGALRERATLINQAFYKIHQHMRTMGRQQSNAAISEAKDILMDGFKLMESMGESRIARNRFAPSFSDEDCTRHSNATHSDIRDDNPADQSSVRRFERHVERWLANNKAASHATGRM